MVAENNFDKLRSKVHAGVPLEKPQEKETPIKKELKPAEKAEAATDDVIVDIPKQAGLAIVEPTMEVTVLEKVESFVPIHEEPSTKPADKRRGKPQVDYQSLFFNRIDFTNRKPLYITATTHRRLMRIVHLMDESKATISSYVENIILNHLETFKEDIDTIYHTNNINPTE